MQSDMPHVADHGHFRMALRAALVPAGLYLLVAVPVTIPSYATVDAQGRVSTPVLCLEGLTGLFAVYLQGRTGYLAMQATHQRRWALLAGLLVVVIGELPLLMATAAFNASRGVGPDGGLTAYNFATTLARYAPEFGLDCLFGLAVGWFGSLVAFKRVPAQGLM